MWMYFKNNSYGWNLLAIWSEPQTDAVSCPIKYSTSEYVRALRYDASSLVQAVQLSRESRGVQPSLATAVLLINRLPLLIYKLVNS